MGTKLVRAEIGAKKYVPGQHRKSTSNERETEFASPELNYWSLVKHKDTAFSVHEFIQTQNKMNESGIIFTISLNL